jgi:hypothetical protein
MYYYQIIKSSKKKIVGCYPQVEEAISAVSINDPRHVGRTFLEPLADDVVVPNAVLNPKAKLTDLVSAIPFGFNLKLLISRRTYDLIANEKTEGVAFLRTYVIASDEIKHEYYIVYPLESYSESLDYSKCRFSISSFDTSDGSLLNIRSAAEFKSNFKVLREEDKGIIKIDTLVFRENLDVHFFCLGQVSQGGIGYFISEHLKVKFEHANLTGFEYLPIQ